MAGWYWIFVQGSTDPQFARVPTFGLGAALLIHAVVSAEIEGQSFSPLLEWFGNISYTLYVVHYVVIKWVASFTGVWLLSTTGTIIASILLSIALAYGLHVTIEAPILSWGRKLSLTRPCKSTLDAPSKEGGVRPSAPAE
ncbi:acyltransferase family protein [Bradyrhizobium liaoningense]|uniref:acyltransferase family protein n=1 Tax=Bradyrhizobium liaoningense TaxID=43992 RepID=UPI001BAA2FFE|nr:acyltransferase [Bradyrhizobium liaoningense]MBR0858019.1 acyltransferase [Bradyrhizobium liaoningense]